jgi:hypothetical protein
VTPTARTIRAVLAAVALATAAAACASPPATSDASPSALSASAPASASASAPAPASASASASAPAPAPEDPKNLTAPEDATGEALQARARALFEGIVADDPARAEPFWFPREPFSRVKDIEDPDKYWQQLHATYERDVHKAHASRKSWDGARFVRYELGSPPKWVKPGEEGNKIGYHRSFQGKLRFEQNGREDALEVRVTITWQGRWFITHLLPFKK